MLDWVPADSAQKRTMTMMVRTMATSSDPSAIEPSEVVHARSSGMQTAGRQRRQPREVVSAGEKYQLPTAPHVVTREMLMKTSWTQRKAKMAKTLRIRTAHPEREREHTGGA